MHPCQHQFPRVPYQQEHSPIQTNVSVVLTIKHSVIILLGKGKEYTNGPSTVSTIEIYSKGTAQNPFAPDIVQQIVEMDIFKNSQAKF